MVCVQYMCMRACAHEYVCTYVHARICVPVCICYGPIFACMYVYVCTHTSVYACVCRMGVEGGCFLPMLKQYQGRDCLLFPSHLFLSLLFPSPQRTKEEEIIIYFLGEVIGCGLGLSISSPA